MSIRFDFIELIQHAPTEIERKIFGFKTKKHLVKMNYCMTSTM